MANVYLASPLYDQAQHRGSARAFYQRASQVHSIYDYTASGSLIPELCNELLCDALNRMEECSLAWFAMLHADVEPEAFWLDKLIAEADRVGADCLSAVVPIKTKEGITSTGISRSDSELGLFCRLTMNQVWHPTFPVTFGLNEAASALESLPTDLRIEGVPGSFLLANTGCMICRLDRPWMGCDPPKVWFEDKAKIERQNGKWRPIGSSEDFVFTRRIAEAGGKVMVTKAVKLNHHGAMAFPNFEPWGQPRDVR